MKALVRSSPAQAFQKTGWPRAFSRIVGHGLGVAARVREDRADAATAPVMRPRRLRRPGMRNPTSFRGEPLRASRVAGRGYARCEDFLVEAVATDA
jgi:hypothetical protein